MQGVICKDLQMYWISSPVAKKYSPVGFRFYQILKGSHVKGLWFLTGSKSCGATIDWLEILFAVNGWENACVFGF